MKEPNIIVCAKQIPDPEAPFSNVTVDAEKMEVIVDAPNVISLCRYFALVWYYPVL